MTTKTASNFLATSTGTMMSEVSYLDARFLAAQPEYEELLRWAGIQKSWKVLDAGAGSGAYLPLLCELVGEDGGLTELDLAPENIQACQTRVRDLKPACQIETKVGSVLQLPFSDAVFDAVWCANTSQYLSDEELSTGLAEFKRVTRPGGLIAIKESDPTGHQLVDIDPAAMWRFLDVARRNDQFWAGLMRGIELPNWFRRMGLVNVRAKMTACTRLGPLKPIEVVALRDIIGYIVKAALDCDVPENDHRQWQQVLEMLMDDHLLEQPEFFFREGLLVVVGEVA